MTESLDRKNKMFISNIKISLECYKTLSKYKIDLFNPENRVTLTDVVSKVLEEWAKRRNKKLQEKGHNEVILDDVS